MTYTAEHAINGPTLKRAVTRQRGRPARRPRCRDSRWPEVAAELAALRATRRRSVRIVDAECGAGTLLLCAVRFARLLGFTAIEARGVEDAPALVERARSAAAAMCDPAIGISFELGEPIAALREEGEFPADIVVWHGFKDATDAEKVRAERLAACAGLALISDFPNRARLAA